MNITLSPQWRQRLALAGNKEVLALLPLVEHFAIAEPEAYVALLPLAQADDFSVRLRALLALGRLGQAAAFGPLLALLKQEQENHWRLAILEALLHLPHEDKINPLLPLLAEDQPDDSLAHFLCGIIWFFGQQGQAAIQPLTEQLLAKPARARRIKDGLLAEAFFLAADGERQILQAMAEKSPPLYRFCSNRVWPRDTRPHYGIYPNPDYLLQIALQRGLRKGQFKPLYYRYRDKAGPQKAPPK